MPTGRLPAGDGAREPCANLFQEATPIGRPVATTERVRPPQAERAFAARVCQGLSRSTVPDAARIGLVRVLATPLYHAIIPARAGISGPAWWEQCVVRSLSRRMGNYHVRF